MTSFPPATALVQVGDAALVKHTLVDCGGGAEGNSCVFAVAVAGLTGRTASSLGSDLFSDRWLAPMRRIATMSLAGNAPAIVSNLQT